MLILQMIIAVIIARFLELRLISPLLTGLPIHILGYEISAKKIFKKQIYLYHKGLQLL